MGLDTTHDAFHGAYSAFNQFRRFIAKGMGGSYPPHEDKKLDNNFWYWDDEYNENTHKGLFILLNHSDCDGEISSEDCLNVANDLESLLPKLEKLAETEPVGNGHLARDGGYIQVTKNFINGCRLEYSRNEPLEFQ